jgi:ABC-type dipeptide/oligopeptide/nickel transport system permease subunit
MGEESEVAVGVAAGAEAASSKPRPSAPLPGGPWRLTWDRFRRDRLSLAAACLFATVVVVSFAGGPISSAAVGHTGNDLFPYAVDTFLKPVGPWTRVPNVNEAQSDVNGQLAVPPKSAGTTLLVLGADGPLGRDELIRLLDGGKTSLEIALMGVFFALLIGVPLGCLGGYFGGWTDAGVARLTEIVMAFPLILFLVLASVRLSSSLTPIGYGSVLPKGVFAVSLLIGVFTSFYPTRLVRVQLLTLKEAEFVQAEHMIGASNRRILRRHLFPHLVPTLLVWSAIAVATNILLEVGISFVGVGVQASTATWGSLLSTTWGTIYAPRPYDGNIFTPWQTLFPTVAILLTVLSLNQISEGLRRAMEPWRS